jgi:hypothetical protein
MFLTFKNNSIEFWDFYHGTNVRAGSPKDPMDGVLSKIGSRGETSHQFSQDSFTT